MRKYYVGKVVGIPSCPDPVTAGLTFEVDDGTGPTTFHIAGSARPNQSPAAALAMAALLWEAKKPHSGGVSVAYDDNEPSTGKHVGVPGAAFSGNTVATNSAGVSLTKPIVGTVYSAIVMDYDLPGGKPSLQTNIDYGGASTVCCVSGEQDLVHFASVLAMGRGLGARVQIDYDGLDGNGNVVIKDVRLKL